jgi:hypothetical protein
MTEMEMPRYKSHKTVWALKIKEVAQNGDGHWYIVPEDERYTIIQADEFVAKHRPEAGGYYVQYADGYKSYSPAKAFEEGYTLCE